MFTSSPSHIGSCGRPTPQPGSPPLNRGSRSHWEVPCHGDISSRPTGPDQRGTSERTEWGWSTTPEDCCPNDCWKQQDKLIIHALPVQSHLYSIRLLIMTYKLQHIWYCKKEHIINAYFSSALIHLALFTLYTGKRTKKIAKTYSS